METMHNRVMIWKTQVGPDTMAHHTSLRGRTPGLLEYKQEICFYITGEPTSN